MDMVRLENTIKEVERFMETAYQAERRFKEDWARDSKRLGLITKSWYTNISKENAACKRASLDLTRSLAELRK